MAWRVIVRFSLNNDFGSALRNTVAQILAAQGISRTATGTWESAATNELGAANCLASVLSALANASNSAAYGGPPGPLLDHLWIYIDQT